MTKKEYVARKLAWRTAIAEGRMLRFAGGAYMTSYPTIEARDAALALATQSGIPCEVVS